MTPPYNCFDSRWESRICGDSINRTWYHSKSEGFNQAFARLWRKYVVDECPDARKERLRQEHIDNIKQAIALLEAMRLWEAQTQKRDIPKIERV